MDSSLLLCIITNKQLVYMCDLLKIGIVFYDFEEYNRSDKRRRKLGENHV